MVSEPAASLTWRKTPAPQGRRQPDRVLAAVDLRQSGMFGAANGALRVFASRQFLAGRFLIAIVASGTLHSAGMTAEPAASVPPAERAS